MKNKLIALVLACVLLLQPTVSGLLFAGSNCNTAASQILSISSADVPACQSGLTLPPGVGVINPSPGFVAILMIVYRCSFSYQSAIGLPVTESALVGQAALFLNDSTFYDLGSSTNSVRLAATVQNAGFNLIYGPNIQLNLAGSPTTVTASRINLLPRGPDFFILGSNLMANPLPLTRLFFVEYFNSLTQGPRLAVYDLTIPPGLYLSSNTCTDTFDGTTSNNCDFFALQNVDETVNITALPYPTPLRVAHCS